MLIFVDFKNKKLLGIDELKRSPELIKAIIDHQVHDDFVKRFSAND